MRTFCVSRAFGVLLALAVLPLVPACSCEPRNARPRDTGGGGAEIDAGTSGIDAQITPGMDAPFVSSDAWNMYALESGPGCETGARACMPVEPGCGGVEVCGNGLDDDCNLEVDEACGCMPGTVQSCFAGPPGSRDVGACSDTSKSWTRAGANR